METTVRPNQSMPDVIIQACGSLEAGGQFCFDNGVSITDIPVPGTKYTVSDEALALGDFGVLRYLRDNRIVIGTLAAAGSQPLLNDDSTPLLNDDGTALFSD